jgi:predicted NBD/HSP70 family sugar kinase
MNNTSCDIVPMPVIGVSVKAAIITGVFRDHTGRTIVVGRPAIRSLTYHQAIAEVVRDACAEAGSSLSTIGRIVVGVSPASLQPSRLRRRIPGGPHWRDVLTTALEFEFAAPVVVRSAIELAALAEQRYGAAKDAQNFALLQAGPEVEAGYFPDGRLTKATFFAARTSDGDMAARLCQALLPVLRSSRPDLVIVGGPTLGRSGAALCAALRRALFDSGARPPAITLTGLAGDAVLAGALAESLETASVGGCYPEATVSLCR